MFNLLPHLFTFIKQFILVIIRGILPNIYQKYELDQYDTIPESSSKYRNNNIQNIKK